MVQIKILLDTRRSKSDGTYSIIFRIINIKKVDKTHWNYNRRTFWDEKLRKCYAELGD